MRVRNYKAFGALLPILMIFTFAAVISAQTQTTAFTYQGRLTDSTMQANGTFDFQFALFDAAANGTQQGTTQTTTGVTVTNGVFTVQLDFTAAPFATGANRFLEIRVKRPADTTYTTLNPRQPISSVPYTTRSLVAATADALSANCVGCVSNAQIAAVDGSKVTGGNSITNLNASNLTTGTVPIARLGTNTPTPNTFLRSDNTFASVAGFSGVTLQVSATNTAAQTITPLAGTGNPQYQNISFNNIITAPTVGTFDGTTFTPTTGGLYLVTAAVAPPDTTNVGSFIQLLVNGTVTVNGSYSLFSSNNGSNRFNSTVSFVLALNANDAVLIRGISISTSTASTLSTNGTTRLAITKLN